MLIDSNTLRAELEQPMWTNVSTFDYEKGCRDAFDEVERRIQQLEEEHDAEVARFKKENPERWAEIEMLAKKVAKGI